MAGEVPTQGNTIIVDPEGSEKVIARQPGSDLASWIIGKVNPWEDHRNRGYAARWKQYWRVWRGFWDTQDKTRQSERSRLIAPALAQAIDSSVSEVESATIDQNVWLDVPDDLKDTESGENTDALMARDQLIEDLDMVNARDTVSEALTNGGVFGTGIMVINTDVLEMAGEPRRNPTTLRLEREDAERVVCTWESVRPDEFIPDPSGKTIQQMLGCARRFMVPMHTVQEKIELNIYRQDAKEFLFPGKPRIRGAEADWNSEPQINQEPTQSDKVEITEWYGKVPLSMLAALKAGKTPLDEVIAFDMAERPDVADGPLIEAIVTIGNQSVLLRAMANPFVMGDRPVIAFQWDKVPGRFWGRGVAEKGINAQKALDAELRSRIDALGFISAPMLGVDSGRMPRGFRMEVKPGKLWLTQGPPREILQPVEIGNLQAATFNQTQEMERMVQMGTGAFDTAGALSAQSSQSGASASTSNSMMMGAFAKRSKRTVGNICRNFIQPAVRATMWRYMQYDPTRYPQDYKFEVKASLGIVAREVEAMQLTQLLGMLPDDIPQVAAAVTKGIIALSSVGNQAEINQALAAAMAPPPPEEQARQQELAQLQHEAAKGQLTQVLLDNQKTIAEIREILSKADVNAQRADHEGRKVDVEEGKLKIAGAEVLTFQEQNEIARKRLDLDEQKVQAQLEKLRQS